MRKPWESMLTVLVTAVLTVVPFQSAAGATTTSAAAANPYNYRDVCGSGYNLVSGGVIDLKTGGGTLYGQMYVTWNSYTKMNCAAVVKRAFVGTPTETAVAITRANSKGTADRGDYSYYAGPVYEIAPGKCIVVSGWVWNHAHTIQARNSASGWCS